MVNTILITSSLLFLVLPLKKKYQMKKLFTLLLLVFAVISTQAQTYPLVDIDSIQFVNIQKLTAGNTIPDYIDPVKKNPRYGDTVELEGYVTFNPKSYGLSTSKGRAGAFLQKDTTGKPWGGVQVLLNTDIFPGDSLGGLDLITQFFGNFELGYKVRCTGVISEFQGGTQINLLKIPTQIMSFTPKTIVPKVVPVVDFMKNDGAGTMTIERTTGEQWEGTYVEFRNVSVVDISASGSRWNWALQDVNGNKIKIQDLSGYYRNDGFDRDPATPRNFTPPSAGTFLSYVRGVINEVVSAGLSEYRLAPLLPSDIGPVGFQPPVLSNKSHKPVVATSSDSVTLSVRITDDSTVVSGNMYYAVGVNNTNFTMVPMVSIGSNRWQAKVPPQPNGSIVKYWFKGTDNGGNSSNFPDTLASGSAYMVVDGGITKISQLQYSPFPGGNSIWMNDTLSNINVPGIVTATAANNDLGLVTLQADTLPFGGIFVTPNLNDSVAGWKRGDSIVIKGCVVTENFNVTTLRNVGLANHQRISTNKPLPAFVTQLNSDSISLKSPIQAEPYEGMLVKFTNTYIVNKNADAPSNFGEFAINKDTLSTVGLRVDDQSNDIPMNYNTDSIKLKQKVNFIQGVLFFSFSNWKLLPRDRADIDNSNGPDAIAPTISLKGLAVVNHPKGAAYTDSGATAYDNKDGDITSKITTTNNLNINNVGTYFYAYNVTDNAGNAATEIRRTINVIATGIDQMVSPWNLLVFPNPTLNDLNVSYSFNKTAEAHLFVSDLAGKIIYDTKLNATAGHNKASISTTAFAPGTYFIGIDTGHGPLVQKFTVIR